MDHVEQTIRAVVRPEDIQAEGEDLFINMNGVMELVMISPQSQEFKTECLRLYEQGNFNALINYIYQRKGK